MDIINLAHNFAKEIQKTDEYIDLMHAKENNDKDGELSDLIGEFNLLKIDIHRLISDDDYDQDEIDSKNAELRQTYKKIMENKNMVAFNKASEKMNDVMNKINNILFAAVNGENFDLMSPGINDLGCGGSCDGCSGCH